MLGLYIHIPFCVQKCKYCDFNSYKMVENKKNRFLSDLKKEMALYKNKDIKINSIFFGGGTPSILNNKSDMIDIDEYCNKELSFQYYKSEEKECSIERRKYPIFYFIKVYFEEERNLEKYLNHPTIKMIYRISSNKLADEIIKTYKYKI